MNTKITNAPGFRDAISRGSPWASDPSYQPSRRDVETLLAKAKIPRRYLDEVLDTPIVTEATAEVDAFIASPKRSLLLLLGPPGTGKTCAAVQGLACAGFGCYALAAELAQAYRWLDYRQRVEAWVSARLLVVDEIGREPTDSDQRSRATVWEVIERRWADRRKTILVTNLLEAPFRQRYDEAAWDRIEGDGGVALITGASLRQRGAA